MSQNKEGKLRVAILGGQGMLGTDLAAVLQLRGCEPAIYDLPEFDICTSQHLDEVLKDVEAVVNCAAYTNVDGAESQPDRAQAVNADAVGMLGQKARERGVYVLHIGTDFVFDGRLDRPYREDDSPNPLSVYGASKLAGEKALVDSRCNHAIVRVQWTYGAAGNNFITKLLERVQSQPEIKMVDDQWGSPTWTRNVAEALTDVLQQRTVGLYHLAANGYATRFQVAQEILKFCKLKKPLIACKTADFPAAAQRPLNSRFDCSRIDRVLRARRPFWADSLQQFLQLKLMEKDV